MARLKDVTSGPIAERRYLAKKFVYLESQEDVQILADRWFNNRREHLEFLPAGNDLGGGCNQVVARVKQDRDSEIEAYGVVDRDALAANGLWEQFLDPDDGRFSSHTPFGKYVIVLHYWEIENYLLHPEVIHEVLEDELGRSGTPLQVVLEDLFDLVCRVIVVVAGGLILNSYGRKGFDLGFGMGQPFDTLYAGVRGQIDKLVSPDAAETLDECIEKLVAFSEASNHRSLEHWLGLIRILDGKRVLRWLSHHYGIGGRDLRWHLARRTRDRGKIEDVLDPSLLSLIAA